jgi:hypothetical protein
MNFSNMGSLVKVLTMGRVLQMMETPCRECQRAVSYDALDGFYNALRNRIAVVIMLLAK